MKRPIALTKLIDILLRLFPEEDRSRMVVKQAGIDDRNIAYDAAAAVNWTNIVSDALRQDSLPQLVDSAAHIHPEVGADLRSLLTLYERWAARYASTPELVEEVAAQPVPTLFVLLWKSIAAWSAVAVGCLALIGVLARESRHLFLGLPGSHLADVADAPRACAIEGAEFLWQTLMAFFDYAFLNPVGCAIVVALFSATWVQRQRLRRAIRHVWTPRIVIATVLVAAAAKMTWYDAPAFPLHDVLGTRNWSRPELLDVPAPLTHVAQERWRAVVCSRVAQLGTENAKKICGTTSASGYQQNLLGAYATNVVLTVLISMMTASAISKLLLPSHRRDWNLTPGRKRTGAAVLGAGLLLAILPVAWTWSRTVRTTKYPAYGTTNRTFYLCAGKDDCYTYRAGRKLRRAERPPAGHFEMDDVLTRSFNQQLAADTVIPEPGGPRFAPIP